ncbi:MAG: D-tyrosyl-tRNA(Tyr) deacylase [Deltaproteobacteria bacterium]|nr:D-tyrosyl-tRNA(Tyr) deacylase [Deltaproteobacteria bacterium]
MISVIQRVKKSSVSVSGEMISEIGPGLLVLLGVAEGDTLADVNFLSNKIINLRIFEDRHRKMNRSLLDIGGEMLVVSQFTLLGDCRKGRRPSFINAARPDIAESLYTAFTDQVQAEGIRVETGSFGAMMVVSLTNDGPVTLIVESPKTGAKKQSAIISGPLE